MELFFQNDQVQNKIEVSLQKLFAANFSEENTRRYDIVVRYLAIENYYGKNDYGFDLYRKMQRFRTLKKEFEDLYEMKFRNLIKLFDQYGYDTESYIKVFDDLNLSDGSHRVALGLYHRLKNISVQILPYKKIINFGLEWFIKNGFSDKEINIIRNKGEVLLQEWKI